MLPGILAFLLIAGGVFGLLLVWHRHKLGRAADTETAVSKTTAEIAAFTYDSAEPLEPGKRYATRRMLRALVADAPATANPDELAGLWSEPGNSLLVIERGRFQVLDRVESVESGVLWYHVRIPEDCLAKRRTRASVEAWIEDSQMTGAELEDRSDDR